MNSTCLDRFFDKFEETFDVIADGNHADNDSFSNDKTDDQNDNDDADTVIEYDKTTVTRKDNDPPTTLSTVVESADGSSRSNRPDVSPQFVGVGATLTDDVEESRLRMMSCAQEILAVVEPPACHAPLIAYSRSPRLRRAPIKCPITATTTTPTTTTRPTIRNNNENELTKDCCYNYYSFNNNNNSNWPNENIINNKSPEISINNTIKADCQLWSHKSIDQVKNGGTASERRAAVAAEMDDLLRHYGDYSNHNEFDYHKGIGNASVYGNGQPIFAYNPLCASPTSSPSISSRRASNNNSMSTSAYSSRSAKSTIGSALVASNMDIWPTVSSPTTPTSPTLPPLRCARLGSTDLGVALADESGCVDSLNSLAKPGSSTESDADSSAYFGRPYLFDHSPLSTRSESFQRVFGTPRSLLPSAGRPDSATRSCFSLDATGAAGRRNLNQFNSASTSAANLIEMQSAVVVDWLKEKAAVRLAELLHAQTARAKSAVNPAKRRLIARFDVDLLKGVRNAVKSAKSTIDTPKKAEPASAKTFEQPEQKVYGMPLGAINARTNDGTPLPRFLRDMMAFMVENAADTVGIFRKNGVKGRILEIRDRCNALGVNGRLPEDLCTEAQLYNLADAFKQYLRDLPECVMTKQVSAMIESCITELPESKTLLAIHYCILLLPSENREALMIILRFLGEICFHSAKNQMCAENLATCLMPSMFYLPHSEPTTKLSRRKTIGAPSERERNAYNALKEALTRMIRDHEYLLSVPAELAGELRVLRTAGGDAAGAPFQIPLKNGVFDLTDEFQRRLRNRLDRLRNSYLAGGKDRRLTRVYEDGTQLFACESRNPISPTEFIVQTTVNTSANRLHALLLHERHIWDQDVETCQRVGSAGPDFDVIEVTYGGLSARKRVYLARRWTYGSMGENRGISSLVERSVMPAGVRDTEPRVLVFKSDFLIVPDDVNSKQCQVVYLSRIDLRGKSLEWYNTVYGEMMAERIRRLKCHFMNANSAPPLPPRRCSANPPPHHAAKPHVESIV